MQRSTFFVKTLAGVTMPVVLTCAETRPAVVLEEIVAQVPAEYHNSRIICAGKSLLDCSEELSRGVGVYFNNLAAIHIIASAPKRPISEDSACSIICNTVNNTKKQRTISEIVVGDAAESQAQLFDKALENDRDDLREECNSLRREVDRLHGALDESERIRAANVEAHREEKARLVEKISELNHIAERRSRISGICLSKTPVGKKVFAPQDF